MSQIIPIYIPTYINNADYTPARVLPRLLFYNGLLDCQTYWIESGSATFGGVTYQQNAFPYFDNYNVVTGSFPTTDSDSLLFNNEAASYGEVPTNSLYTTYWEKYIEFLYNPKTRILNCSAIIPLADYFKMELNDIVNFRGNYWHLRAINDYSLKTGECELQLLGPVIPDVFDIAPPIPPPPPAQASSSVSWSYTESSQDGTFTVFDNASTIATLTANGNGNTQISESHYITASLVPVSYPSSGSVTMSLNVNGGTTLAVTGSTNTTISASFLVGAAQTYNITGSIQWNDVPTLPIDWLLIAGGASGGTFGNRNGGGGGAGRFVSSSANINFSSSLAITIGNGGTSVSAASSQGNNGSDSTIVISSTTYTAPGGGGGGAGLNSPSATRNGKSGGSGGGGAGTGVGGSSTGGSAVDGSPIVGFGNAGENKGSASDPVAGYGGGAGGTPTGLAWLDGITYCVGGSGITNSNGSTAGSGGGGGGSSQNSGAGANGICIIRYAGTPVATGGTITQSGGYTYHTFTSSSNFVY
jgi:hypothetical protein